MKEVHELTSLERRIVDVVRESLGAGESATISQIASRVPCSASTVSTLAKKLGYRGWPDMRYRMAIEMAAPTEEASILFPHMEDVRLLLEQHKDDAIFVHSIGDGSYAGGYLQALLCKHGFACMHTNDQVLLSQARKGKAGIDFVINESGIVMLDAAQLAHSLGYTVVAFTGRRKSSVAEMADVSIVLKSNKSSPETYQPDFFCARVMTFCALMFSKVPYLGLDEPAE